MSRTAAGVVVVVTGASSGIGRATALDLARSGARLVLSARSAGSLEAAAGECRALGAEVLTVVADVVDEADVERVLDTRDSRGSAGVDGWVHTAAVVAYGRFEDVPSATFRRVLDTNVHGTVHAARVALRPVPRRRATARWCSPARCSARSRRRT